MYFLAIFKLYLFHVSLYNIFGDKMEENKIKEVINKIRPFLVNDGGNIEFIKYEDGYVYIKLYGACQDCGFQDTTINEGLLQFFQSEIPEIEGVININL